MNTLNASDGLCTAANQLINAGEQSADEKRETTISGDGKASNCSPPNHSASGN